MNAFTPYPRLHRALLTSEDYRGPGDLERPAPGLYDLPERVVQFGTGGFLRAFADYFIDRANRRGLFNGRVVLVQSTGRRRADALAAQDGLYTLWVRGLEAGHPVERLTVCAAVSRALSAQDEWTDVLACARNPDLALIVSNTTEVGLTLDPGDRLDAAPPRSFPGKLAAFLYERARHFDFSAPAGLVVLPCELVEANGETLRGHVRTLAERKALGTAFLDWLDTHVVFCNTLVDRIVPGQPEDDARAACRERLAYEDALLTVAEVYRLWAVEGDDALRRRLAFADADPGVLVTGDITPYRERKIRLLNGGHTLSVPLAFLLGNETVLDAMRHPLAGPFAEALLREALGPSLDVDPDTIPPYIDEVLDRWRNPYLHHRLLDITFQSTTKMRHRVTPSLLRFAEKTGTTPRHVALGFAAYLLFMRGVEEREGRIFGRRGEIPYPINDDHAPFFLPAWHAVDPGDKASITALVTHLCAHDAFWGVDLTTVPDFCGAVVRYLSGFLQDGIAATLRAFLSGP